MNPQTKNKTNNPKKKVLFATLDWGLGHAVRDIPLIRQLLEAHYDLVLAGSGASLAILNDEFPNLESIKLHSNQMVYSSNERYFMVKLLLQFPGFFLKSQLDRIKLNKIVKIKSIDLIISDNRYGCHHKKTKNIFITHQIFPKLSENLKFFEPLVGKIHLRLIKSYDLCLIPDYPGNVNFSGELSHKHRLTKKFRFIGVLSDFQPCTQPFKQQYDILFVASGPEPQRTLFIENVFAQIKAANKKALIVTGEPLRHLVQEIDQITMTNHLSRTLLREKILSSETVITQAGYTSIMDLIILGKKAILIPTPGQTEQDYLAYLLKYKGMFIIEDRQTFQLENAREELRLLNAQFPDIKELEHDDFLSAVHEMCT